MQEAIIVGKECSGKEASALLFSQNYKVHLVDDYSNVSKNDMQSMVKASKMVILSPAITKQSPWVKEAKVQKKEIISELELASRFNSSQIIAITGTNGKTTTTELTGKLFATQFNTFVGGNIGVPFSKFCLQTTADSYSILEISSFMLENIKTFKPHIAVMLNLSPDHLNRHGSLKIYYSTKAKIFSNMGQDDFAVLNADDELVIKYAKNISSKVYYFSTQKEVEGCFIKNNNIYFKSNEKLQKVCSVSKIKIVGEHNLSNCLASILCFLLAGGKIKNIAKTLSNFYGVEHRLAFVDKICGVEFYNDSKSTNIDSTLVATKSFKKPIVLLLGGSDKGLNFDRLFEKLPKNVLSVIVFGEVKEKLIASAHKAHCNKLKECSSLKTATTMAFVIAPPKSIVLLSPATASFDMFSNYEERGKFFVSAVKELSDEVKKVGRKGVKI